MKGRKGALLRLTVSSVLLGVLLWQVGIGELAREAAQADPPYLLLGLLLTLVTIVVRAYRWHVLLQSSHVPVPLGRAISFTFIGLFFSNFLPTTVGGDVAKTYALARYQQKAAGALASVVVDRLVGIYALLAVAAVSLALGGDRLDPSAAVTVGVVILGVGLVAVLVSSPRVMGLLRAPLARLERFPLVGKLLEFHDWFTHYHGRHDLLVWMFLISLPFYGLMILSHYVVALALDLDLPFVLFAVVVPMVSLAAMLPISIGGLGIREGGFAFFFVPLGVPLSSALLLSLIPFLYRILSSLPGALFYALGHAEGAGEPPRRAWGAAPMEDVQPEGEEA